MTSRASIYQKFCPSVYLERVQSLDLCHLINRNRKVANKNSHLTASERLRNNSERILELFVAAVRRDIDEAKRESESILRDALPSLLEQLAKMLTDHSHAKADAKVEEVGIEHAEQRINLTNYSLNNVLSEYHLLRRIIFQVLQQDAPLSFTESDMINYVIDRGIAQAGQHYMELSEARLLESQEHFQLLVEGTIEYAIFMLSPEGNVQTWNKGAERIKGYKAEEIIGKHFSIFYPPQAILVGHPAKELKIAAAEGKYEEEGMRVRKDGTSFLANVVINSLRDEHGKIKGYSKVTRDITELKNAEDLFRIFANSINQLAWIADEHGWIQWYNSRWYEYTGTSIKDMEGWGWQSVHHPEVLPKVLEKWQGSIASGTPFDMVFPLKSAAGEYRSFLTRVVPVRDSEGRILRWFGTNTDIQAQKDIETALAEANDKAKLALRVRDEFISIASHELKTPLTSLLLQVQMRSRKLLKGELTSITPDQISKMIETDKRQLERISRLIDDMLDVARINTGNLTIHLEHFDLCGLAQEVLDTHHDQFTSMGSKVTLVCCDPVEGTWDRFRIEQAIANLLTNAAKYGSGKEVEVSVAHDNNRAKLIVRDQGMGIATEHLDRIFNRFERAVIPSEVSGLGLGLFITRQIVELHGGTIRVESELGKGSTFIMELPFHPPGL